jgi:hypothetical protein
MKNKALEAWAWVLIYGGLLLVMLGFFVQAQDGGGGWLKVLGAVLVVPGVVMIALRAKRPGDGA